MVPEPSRSLPLPALLLVALAGCASEGLQPVNVGSSATPSSPWGHIVEEKPLPPEPLQGPLSVATPSVQPPVQKEYTAAEREFMDGAWTAFKVGDPAWEEGRAAWMKLGPEARGVLADNLYRAMVASRARGAIHLVQIARKELVLLGEDSVPVLVSALATRAVRTPDGEELRVGQEVLHDAAEALSVIGAPAVPGLMDIAGSGVFVLAREAIWALGNIGDPRSEGLLMQLAAHQDWSLRAEAVLALRHAESPRAGEVLVQRLEDTEGLVVQRAAEALAARKREDVLPAVLAVLDRATATDRVTSARAAHWVLVRLTGENLDGNPETWRRHLRTR